MGYSHGFHGVDIDRLSAVYGSDDEQFISDVLTKQAEDLEEKDQSFETEIEDGDCPNSETALREIVAGTPGEYEMAEAMYGYVLEIICEHIGQPIYGAVSDVRAHPYDSQLVSSGPPIPIPYDPTDFPEIGFLALSDIPAEIEKIDAAPRKAKKPTLAVRLAAFILSRLTGEVFEFRENNGELLEDMDAYRRTLEQAVAKKVALVSFPERN